MGSVIASLELRGDACDILPYQVARYTSSIFLEEFGFRSLMAGSYPEEQRGPVRLDLLPKRLALLWANG
jgi:hypothetical protein